MRVLIAVLGVFLAAFTLLTLGIGLRSALSEGVATTTTIVALGLIGLLLVALWLGTHRRLHRSLDLGILVVVSVAGFGAWLTHPASVYGRVLSRVTDAERSLSSVRVADYLSPDEAANELAYWNDELTARRAELRAAEIRFLRFRDQDVGGDLSLALTVDAIAIGLAWLLLRGSVLRQIRERGQGARSDPPMDQHRR